MEVGWGPLLVTSRFLIMEVGWGPCQWRNVFWGGGGLHQGGGWQEVLIVDFTREVDGKKS